MAESDKPAVDTSALLIQAFERHRTGDLKTASEMYRKILDVEPENPDALHLLGMVFRALGRNEDAAKMIQRCVKVKPDFADAHYNLGNVLLSMNRLGPALHHYKKATENNPNHADAWYNLANGLRSLNRFGEAAKAFQAATKARPEHVGAWHNLGNLLRDVGKMKESLACFRKVLKLSPDLAEAHYNYGLALMTAGDLENGSREYEWRWKVAGFPSPPRNFRQPQWDGRRYALQTLLVHAEQGMGDTIQFLRYLPRVRALGGRLVVEVPPPLVGLVKRMNVADMVVAQGSPLPPFDIQLPMMSLIHVMGTTLDDIPDDVPYLKLDPARVRAWQQRFRGDGRVRIGIAWAGNPKNNNDVNRSLPIEKLALLPKSREVAWINLIKGPQTAELARSPLPIQDFSAEIESFEDTAALTSTCKLVISVDTSVAHLAGALGVRTWTLIPYSPDWRWLWGHAKTGWYPSMRLFRQAKPGDWDTVLEHVSGQLTRMLGGAAR